MLGHLPLELKMVVDALRQPEMEEGATLAPSVLHVEASHAIETAPNSCPSVRESGRRCGHDTSSASGSFSNVDRRFLMICLFLPKGFLGPNHAQFQLSVSFFSLDLTLMFY